MAVKYVFVTGGVVSGLGKGITAASLGRLLKARGYKVTMQKFDPYINVDPGTMNPIQHGEVFVTDDGTETDLDLGHYERFIDESLDKNSNVTTGKVYWSVLQKERHGDFGGGTVQVIPCVILNAFQVDYTPETVRGLLVAFAASLLMQVVLLFAVSALGRVFHLDAVEITSVYYSNSGNLIVPLVTAVLGAEWVLYSCVYMSVQLVFFWTHCKKVISREASYDWKKIVLNLNIISIFVGILLFFTGIRLPALVNNTLHSVGSMVGPASMIVTGMLFAGMDFRQIFANKRIYFVTFLRLIAVPGSRRKPLRYPPYLRS